MSIKENINDYLLRRVPKESTEENNQPVEKIDIPEAQKDQWLKDPEAEKYRRKPWGIFNAVDWLNNLQYPIANTARRLTDKDKDYTLEEYGKGAFNGVAGNERSSFSDVFGNLGWKPYKASDKMTKAAVSLVADIATDPITYASFGLNQVGRAAKLGRLIKIGDELVDLTKLKNVKKARDILAKGMRAAGVADNVIDDTLKGYKGIKGASFADDLVRDLNKYGQVAEKVELAPTWAKQYKAGQRSLIRFEAPKIFGGFEAELPRNKVGQKIANAGTWVGNRVEAGRAVANKTLWNNMPQATEAVEEAAKKGNLFKIGDKYFDLATEKGLKDVAKFLKEDLEVRNIEGAEDFAKSLLSMGENVSDKTTGLADIANQTFRTLGVERGEKALLTGLRNQVVAKKAIEKAPRFWKGVGSAVNSFSDTFNVIPEQARMIKRFANNASRRMGISAGEDVAKILGDNANEILSKGLPKDGFIDLIDDNGNVIKQVKDNEKQLAKWKSYYAKKGINVRPKDDYGSFVFHGTDGDVVYNLTPQQVKAKRYEGVEVLGHPAVQHELREIEKTLPEGGRLTKEHYKEAVESLRASKNEEKIYGKWQRRRAGRMAEEGSELAAPSFGLSDQQIDRVIDTIDDLDNIGALDELEKARQAAYYTARTTSAMGHTSKHTLDNFVGEENIIPIQRNLEVDDVDRVISGGGGLKSNDDMVRKASRGQTMFEARLGIVDPESAKYYRDNFDKIVAHDVHGKPVYGRDILSPKVQKLHKQAVKIQKQALEGSGNVSELTAQYEQLQKDIAKLSENRKALNFSLDLQENLANALRSAEANARIKLTLQGIVEKLPDLNEGGTVSRGYVKADDILPKIIFDATEITPENAAQYRQYAEIIGGKELVEALKNKQIPYEMVAPIEAMLRPRSEKAGLVNLFYRYAIDPSNKVLKPFMLSAPGTHLRNFISSIFMGINNGQYSRPNHIKNSILSFLWTNAKFKDKRAFADLAKNIDERAYKIADLWEDFVNRGGGELNTKMADALYSPDAKLTFGKKVGQKVEKATEYATIVQKKVAARTENWARFATYLNCLDDGMTPDQAMEFVSKVYYDYGDVSRFEQEHMKRWFPFYSFWRKNAGANLRYATTRPSILSYPTKMARDINIQTEEDDHIVPQSWLENGRNAWLLKQGAVRLPWGDGQKFFNTQGFLTQMDFPQWLDADEAVQTTLGMIHPIPKIVYENIRNKDLFLDKPIVSDAYPYNWFLGMDMNPRLAKNLRLMGILGAIDRGYKEYAADEAAKHGEKPKNKKRTQGERLWEGIKTAGGLKTYDVNYKETRDSAIRTIKHKRDELMSRIKHYDLNDKNRAAIKRKIDIYTKQLQDLGAYKEIGDYE